MQNERSRPKRTFPQKPENRAQSPKSTSWQKVEKWYNEATGAEGHYYHQHVVMPGILKLFALDKSSSVLDLACGQGVLARHLPKDLPYVGLDIAPSLIKAAKELDPNPRHEYFVADVTQTLPIKKTDFTHATIVLAIQNIEHPLNVFKSAFKCLAPGGTLTLILNHPCFRIPRQSSWKVDPENKTQYRRLDRYFSEMKIPIQANPSKGEKSESTWSFHHPLSAYTKWLTESGFLISAIEEWCSNKVSTGAAAKMENRAREEFPLFMAIQAKKM